MYDLGDKIIAKGIGRCIVIGRSYDMPPRYMLKDRLDKIHDNIPSYHVRAANEPDVTPVASGHSVQFISHPVLVKA